MKSHTKFTAIAATLDIDPRTLERIASSDPEFPAIIQQSARVRLVANDALDRWLMIREQRSAISRVVRNTEVQA